MVLLVTTGSQQEDVAMSYQISAPSTQDKLVPVGAVMRGGSIIVGSLSALALIAYFLSGVIIIQPFICLLLLIVSIGFGAMGMARPAIRKPR